MIFFPGLHIHRIEYEVGVDVFFVNVRTDDHFIIRQILSSEFLCDFQCQLWGNFSRLEGLNDMVALASIQLSDGPLGIHHLLVL